LSILVNLALELVKPSILIVKSFREGINLGLVRLFGWGWHGECRYECKM